MHPNYHINDTFYENPPDDYKNKDLYDNFLEKYEEFKNQIVQNHLNGIPLTYYKFGDGDYYFLKKQSVGSAKPGKRALKKPYWLINHKEFVKQAKNNDYYLCEIFESNTKRFIEIFDRDFDFPAEFVYGSISNRWLLNEFSNDIGIIGAKEKVELIYELMQHGEYKDYLGLDEFKDYLTIPQKYACDNLKQTKKNLEKQLKNSSASIFLLGVGHVKSGLLSYLKTINNAIYLDIGSGVDALAGIVDIERPYFGNWKNFKLKNSIIYKNIDYLNYKGKGENIYLN